MRIFKVGFEPDRRSYVDSEVEPFGHRSNTSIMRDSDPHRSGIRSDGFRRKRSRSSSTESVVRRRSAMRNDRRTRDGGFEPSGSPSNSGGSYDPRPVPWSPPMYDWPDSPGPTVPDLILRRFR